MSSLQKNIKTIREDYDKDILSEENLPEDPVELFEKWLNLAFQKNVPEPIAMNVATVNKAGRPSSRIVLLRGFDKDGFVFYTNYHSRKGKDIDANPYAALCFYWYDLNKQVRIEGRIAKVAAAVSDEYFGSRPPESRLGAWASDQSSVIGSRQELEKKLEEMAGKFGDDIPRPPHWGGYRLTPDRFEFWQGRTSRLHDRIQYDLENNRWKMSRLAP